MNNHEKGKRGEAGKINGRALGENSAFHNPYTFMPFSNKAPELSEPALLTADEEPSGGPDRFTGIIELEIKTLSPLLTANPVPRDPEAEHKTYDALLIGRDVIVPASGVRGMLRSLLIALTGGALTTLDKQAYLCQGRDAKLGPRGKSGGVGVPVQAFLGRVVEPGDQFRDGSVELGETDLVKLEDLKRLVEQHPSRVKLDGLRPTSKVAENQQRLFIDNPGGPRSMTIGTGPANGTLWEVRLSGRPVKSEGKREGAFKRGGLILEVPKELWAAYTNRHRHAVRPELRAGDLVWLEPSMPNMRKINSAADIKSLQWARWGREGQAVEDCLPEFVLPDFRDPDGRVGEVTNLFGMVSPERGSGFPAFAGRVRPENLVFPDSAGKVQRVTLAPLSAPHPGCVPFYRKLPDDTHRIPKRTELRGYKVYRTARESGEKAPWHYATQGIYDGKAGPRPAEGQGLSKIVHLVPAGTTGTLNLAVRGISKRELALLIQACHVHWRVGGGKPLGLGLCRATAVRVIDEMGAPVALAKIGWERLVADIADRVNFWEKSQSPVEKLRYPRAVSRNNNNLSRGGHVWFQRHAALRKDGAGREGGPLEPFDLQGRLLSGEAQAKAKSESLPPQPLPNFNPDDPSADVLYGYDLVAVESEKRVNQAKLIIALEPFDPARHVAGSERSGGNTSQNRETRQAERAGRAAEAPPTPPKPAPLARDQEVEAVLVGEKTKAGGWRALHEASGLVGPIQNSKSPEFPGSVKPGDRLKLLVAIANGREVAFRFPTDKERADAAKRLVAKAAPKTNFRANRRF